MGRNKNKPARLSELFRYAHKHAEQLERGELGVPDATGKAHIVWSVKGGEKKEATLHGHVDKLAKKWRLQRGAAAIIEITRNPTIDDIRTLVQDDAISTLAFVGHGSLGSWWLFDGNSYHPVSWYDFASMTTHLKQGIVEQRTCAPDVDNKNVRVPVGTFLVSDQRNTLAPLGYGLLNSAGFDEFEAVMRPVYESGTNEPSDLIAQVNKRFREIRQPD